MRSFLLYSKYKVDFIVEQKVIFDGTKQSSSVTSFNHSFDFDYKRETKNLYKIMKQCTVAHTIDIQYILNFLSSFDSEQRLILVRELEFQHDYKLVDSILAEKDSLLRSCTLALIMESEELYSRNFHDLLHNAYTTHYRSLLEILLTMNKEDMKKFKDYYKQIYTCSVESDVKNIVTTPTIFYNLILAMLEEQRSEQISHSATSAKQIAKLLYEAGEGTPGLDHETFIQTFAVDSFSQLSAIFDEYEDKYGKPINVAINQKFTHQIERESFEDIIQYTRNPATYFSNILHKSLNENPIDYTSLIRIIIGHSEKDLCEIALEYSKLFELLEQTISKQIETGEIKKLFLKLVTNGHSSDIQTQHSNGQSSHTGMRRNRSQEALDKVLYTLKGIRHQ
ncbi:unnamed protein product [Didymodactylos carnosus]|uniref:Annexin n=1 Tax=Didymodactylos carnosus TaxID=1234261 RepID=A0A815FMG0_9BILA|nr:unnamed protein product [Didymodactylos carnosus]CAF1325527.1 unnamed protein product [Didymodactylos carnosus]CAF3994409.1 unnamed protein product [Didymodactylos carnosus]CAF4174954.1 unnamed protein product [Didymodactylos carnosus]